MNIPIDLKEKIEVLKVDGFLEEYYGHKYTDNGSYENALVAIKVKHQDFEYPFWVNAFTGAQYRDSDANIVSITRENAIDFYEEPLLYLADGILEDKKENLSEEEKREIANIMELFGDEFFMDCCDVRDTAEKIRRYKYHTLHSDILKGDVKDSHIKAVEEYLEAIKADYEDNQTVELFTKVVHNPQPDDMWGESYALNGLGNAVLRSRVQSGNPSVLILTVVREGESEVSEYEISATKNMTADDISVAVDDEYLDISLKGNKEGEGILIEIKNQQSEKGVFIDTFSYDGEEHLEIICALDEEDIIGEEAYNKKYLEDEDTDEEVQYENHYRCEKCDVEWDDTWDCECDDDCPKCGTTYSPLESEEIA